MNYIINAVFDEINGELERVHLLYLRRFMAIEKDLVLEEFLGKDVQPILEETKDQLSLDYLDSKIYKDNNEVILEVHIDKNFSITIDDIEKFTTIVNEKLDKLEDKIGPYLLDISSSTSDRLIKYEELPFFVNKYLDIKFEKEELKDVKLLELDNKKILIRYFIKGRKKELVLLKEDIKEIHASYKS